MSAPTLEDAIALALRVHRGAVDKGGAPYILHPLRLMVRMGDPDARVVAVLHDVVEDGDVTLDDLRAQGYSARVVAALDRLTRRRDPPESYEAFIERVADDPLARAVKRADLEDNLDVRRLAAVGPDEAARLTRYLRALERLRT